MIVEGQDGSVKDTDLLQVGQLGYHDEVKCQKVDQTLGSK